MKYKYKMGIIALILLIIVGSSFFFGRYNVPPLDVLQIILSKISPYVYQGESFRMSAVWLIRIPRIIVALLVGAGLSVAGAAYQGVFRNPLVSSDLLGVSAAAGFGAALSILFLGTVSNWTALMAFVFGIIGVAFTYFLSLYKGVSSTITLVLSGIVVSALFNAGISSLKYLADPEDTLPAITFWLMGSLSAIRWSDVALCLPVIVVSMIILIMVSWKINLLTLGDKEAKSMGVKTERLKAIIIIFSTIISATCVCVCGTVGWVGLVIPHISRIIVGPDYHKMIPASILIGAAFLLLIDNLTRTLADIAIPLSIMTAFIGAPFFAVLLRRTGGGNLK